MLLHSTLQPHQGLLDFRAQAQLVFHPQTKGHAEMAKSPAEAIRHDGKPKQNPTMMLLGPEAAAWLPTLATAADPGDVAADPGDVAAEMTKKISKMSQRRGRG